MKDGPNLNQSQQLDPFAKISFRERMAFAIGDFGFNFVYGAVAIVYTFFLTDYVGIPVYYAGLIILFSRIFDGLTDLIIGHLTKKTNTRWGRMRPWLLICCGPFMITFVLMFTVPDVSLVGKIAYVAVIYNINQAILSSTINLPYGALGALMSRDQRERTVLQTFRMVIAPMGSLLASASFIPLAIRLGDDIRAWVIVSIIFAILGALCIFYCFADTRERVKPEIGQEESQISFWKSLSLLVRNYYWWVGLSLWASMNYIFAGAGTAVAFYTAHVIGDSDWMLATQIAERVTLVIGISAMPYLIKKVGGKKPLILLGALIVIGGQLMMLVAGASVAFLILNSITRGLGVAGIQGCTFIVVADASEYGLWKDGYRQEGMIYSAGSVGAKLGPGVGTALVSLILAMYNYDGMAAVQTAEALVGIRMALVWPPIFVCVLLIILMIPYKLDKIYPTIVKELAEREAKEEVTN